MTEINPQTTPAEETEPVEKTNFIKTFVAKHPRLTRVAGISAAAATVVGIVLASKSMKDDDSQLGSGADVLELNPSTETTLVAEA